MEKPHELYPVGVDGSSQLILLKLDYIIYQNEEKKKMDEETTAALAEIQKDITAISTGINALNASITSDTGLLATKDALIAELQSQLAAGFQQDTADKQALTDLQTADATATANLKAALDPLVTQADALSSSFASVTPPLAFSVSTTLLSFASPTDTPQNVTFTGGVAPTAVSSDVTIVAVTNVTAQGFTATPVGAGLTTITGVDGSNTYSVSVSVAAAPVPVTTTAPPTVPIEDQGAPAVPGVS